jgi:zinc protease
MRERVGTFAEQAFRDATLAGRARRHGVAGTPDSVRALTLDDVRAFHRAHYDLRRAVIAVVGDVPPRTARRVVHRVLGEMEETDVEAAPLREAKATVAATTVELRHPSGRGYLVSGTVGPAYDGTRERAATEIIRLAVGWRVFEEMTDRLSIAYQAGPLYLDDAGPTPLAFYVGAEPASLPKARAALEAILEEARKGEIADDLLRDAKGAWFGAHARSYLRSDEVAIRLAGHLSLERPRGSEERLAALVRIVRAEEIRRQAAELLAPDRRVTVIVAPEGVVSK